MPSHRKKIALLILGGTVLSEEDPEHNAVFSQRDITPWLEKMPEIRVMINIVPIFLVGERERPDVQHWMRAAKLIVRDIEKYDGFVITHPTDSLIYAANAFSFMLQGVPKPVVFTGSQIPIPSSKKFRTEESFTNYRGLGIKANFINAVEATLHELPEIIVISGNKLLRATQARMMRGMTPHPFDAPPEAVLGTVDFGMKILEHKQRSILPSSFSPRPQLEHRISVVELYPTLDAQPSPWTTKETRGLFIKTYDLDLAFSKLEKIFSKKVTLPTVIHSHTSFPDNPSSPIVVAHRMTFETTLVKFMWALAQTSQPQKIHEILRTNLVHEFFEEKSEEKEKTNDLF